jgi:hypothetical protein
MNENADFENEQDPGDAWIDEQDAREEAAEWYSNQDDPE